MGTRRYPSTRITNSRDPNNQMQRPRTNSNNYQSYTTVVDYDAKYNNRQIQSNWGKYQQDIDLECNNDELSKQKDFNFLLANASSDCSYFEFRCEKEWKKESTLLPSSKIFNLDLKVLSNGLACVPFYERIGLDESELTPDDKAMFDKAAENQRKIYNPIKDSFLKQFPLQSENTQTQSCVDDLISKLTESTLEELLETKFDLSVEDETVSMLDNKQNVDIEKNFKPVRILKRTDEPIKQMGTKSNESETKTKVSVNPSNSVFNDDGENLEEWLDNMLGPPRWSVTYGLLAIASCPWVRFQQGGAENVALWHKKRGKVGMFLTPPASKRYIQDIIFQRGEFKNVHHRSAKDKAMVRCFYSHRASKCYLNSRDYINCKV